MRVEGRNSLIITRYLYVAYRMSLSSVVDATAVDVVSAGVGVHWLVVVHFG